MGNGPTADNTPIPKHCVVAEGRTCERCLKIFLAAPEEPNVCFTCRERRALLSLIHDAAVSLDEMLPYALECWYRATEERFEDAIEVKTNRAKEVLKRLKSAIEAPHKGE